MKEEEKDAIEEFEKNLRLAINVDVITTTIRNDDAQTILNLIEKLQKENERLKKQVEYDKTHIYTPRTIELNFVSKQKIKDKIEELKINLVNMQGEELLIYESKIDVLQELLEGRK